jgi:hypothetical protein
MLILLNRYLEGLFQGDDARVVLETQQDLFFS